MKTKLSIFAIGALALVIGDYLYGTTYYTNLVAIDDSRFLVSSILGYVASLCYLYGLYGYAEGFLTSDGLWRKLTIGGLSIFFSWSSY